MTAIRRTWLSRYLIYIYVFGDASFSTVHCYCFKDKTIDLFSYRFYINSTPSLDILQIVQQTSQVRVTPMNGLNDQKRDGSVTYSACLIL